jgi:Protein of unknown function DUF262
LPRQTKQSQNSTLADKLFPHELEEFSDSILSIPPEQRRLHTETYDYSIATVVDYLKSGHIFVPKFQRGYVWTETQAARLIESLIIQCPVPVIYLSQEPDERLSVIDGNQRLQSILRYVENLFDLKGLTAYPELEGLKYFQLDPRFQRHIMNRTLRCIVIMKDTHPQVKFDVFERLNTGAVKLSAQELRHGIYHGKLIDWLDRIGRNVKWRNLTSGKSDRRMKAEEFLLRFLALHFDFEKYEKPLAAFLNAFAEAHRDASDADLRSFEEAVTRATDRVDAIFGDLAFKIFDHHAHDRIISQFNAALFDAEMLGTSRSQVNIEGLSEFKRKRILVGVSELFEHEAFQRAITLATSDTAQIRARVKMVQDVIATNA